MNKYFKNYELAFLAFAPFFAFLVLWTGFPLSYGLFRIILDKVALYLLGVYALAVPVILFRVLHLRKSGIPFSNAKARWRMASQPYLSLGFFRRTLTRILVILFTLYFFLHVKHLILWWHHANFDLFFWNWDRILHFGVQPNIWAMEAVGDNQELAVGLDWLYSMFFKFNAVVPLCFLLEIKGERLTNQFCTAATLMWFVGGLGYLALPADGPCYAVLSAYSIPKADRAHIFAYPVVRDIPQSYTERYQQAKIWSAKGYQERLWVDRKSFLKGERVPGIFYGIAAFPSLHVGITLLFSLFLFHLSGVLGLLGIIYTLFVGFGSVYLQWHYALDGYAGALLAMLCYFLCYRAPRAIPTSTSSATMKEFMLGMRSFY